MEDGCIRKGYEVRMCVCGVEVAVDGQGGGEDGGWSRHGGVEMDVEVEVEVDVDVAAGVGVGVRSG